MMAISSPPNSLTSDANLTHSCPTANHSQGVKLHQHPWPFLRPRIGQLRPDTLITRWSWILLLRTRPAETADTSPLEIGVELERRNVRDLKPSAPLP